MRWRRHLSKYCSISLKIKSSTFVKSSAIYKDCPKPLKPEYAFIGRSNVGKSSLINSIVNKKNLAKTSSTPGKTQLINHYIINNSFYIVDLPGIGYAKTSKITPKFITYPLIILTLSESILN